MRDFDRLADLQAADESTVVPVGTPGAYTGVQRRPARENKGPSPRTIRRRRERRTVHSRGVRRDRSTSRPGRRRDPCAPRYVDLERFDPTLVGFSGGFVVRSAEPRFERPLTTTEARAEWWDSCHAVELRASDKSHPVKNFTHVAHVVRSDIIRNCIGWDDVCDARPKAHECDCEEVYDNLPDYVEATTESESLVGTAGLSEMFVPGGS